MKKKTPTCLLMVMFPLVLLAQGGSTGYGGDDLERTESQEERVLKMGRAIASITAFHRLCNATRTNCWFLAFPCLVSDGYSAMSTRAGWMTWRERYRARRDGQNKML